MKESLKRKWAVPVAALVLSLSIGTAAFAATGSSATDTSTATVTSTAATTPDATAPASAPAGATASNPWGNQRSDETLLTGSTLDQVKAVVLAEVGSDATIVRIETDADNHGAYEGHVVTSDGTAVTVYVDASFKLVSVENQGAGGHAGGRGHAPAADATSTDSSTTTTI